MLNVHSFKSTVCIIRHYEPMEKQKEVLLVFINGNIFVSLSTGYGKCINYEIIPLVYGTLKSKKSVEVPYSPYSNNNSNPVDPPIRQREGRLCKTTVAIINFNTLFCHPQKKAGH